MTDDEPASSDAVEPAATHSLLRAEQRIIRLTFWQTILSGPVRMQDVRLSIDGNAARNYSELVASVSGDGEATVTRNFISDRVLRPDEKVVVFSTENSELARKLVKAVGRPSTALTFCYCSIFDDSWLADSREDLQAPKAVESCPDFGSESYLNQPALARWISFFDFGRRWRAVACPEPTNQWQVMYLFGKQRMTLTQGRASTLQLQL